MWLHDAAGNSNPANAAHVTLTVPPGESHSGSSGSSNPNGKDSGNTNSDNNDSTAPKSKLHIVEALRHRKLIVRVTGPMSGLVKVHYTARYRGKVIAARSKTTNLRHGKLTVIFTLSVRAAARTTIRVSAHLSHYPPAVSTPR